MLNFKCDLCSSAKYKLLRPGSISFTTGKLSFTALVQCDKCGRAKYISQEYDKKHAI